MILINNLDRKSIAKLSSIVGIVSQVIMTLFSFLIRKILLNNLGVEYLGVQSTLTQILGALALSELGIQTVIVFKLYKPLIENQKDTVCMLLTIFKKVYRIVAIFIISVSFLLLPFLDIILKNNNIPHAILYPIWLIMAFSSASTYLLSYNRAIFYADQKEFIVKIIDMLSNIFFSILKIIFIIKTKSFILFITMDVGFNYLSNIIILYFRKKYYPWIKKITTTKVLVNDIKRNVLDVFFGKLSGYIFNSTDNIVISSIIGTSFTGVFGNYITVTTGIKVIIHSIASPIQNIGGRFLADKSNNNCEDFLFKYQFIIYLIIIFFLLPMGLLIGDFIELFYGEQYKLSSFFVLTLTFCMYCELMQIPLGIFVDGTGLFKQQKLFLLFSALINIVVSVIAAYSVGIIGVLFGTILGHLINWICRLKLSYKYIIIEKKYGVKSYLTRIIFYTLLFFLLYFIFNLVFYYLFKVISISNFIIKGVMIEFISFIVIISIYRNTSDFKYAYSLLKHKL